MTARFTNYFWSRIMKYIITVLIACLFVISGCKKDPSTIQDEPTEANHLWNVKTNLPQNIIEQRNELLAKADNKIRLGLIDISAKFPQLKKARDWEREISGQSNKGRIAIHLSHGNNGKVKTTQEFIPETERFSLLIFIQSPPEEPHQLVMGTLYPNLGLVGQIVTRAGDPKLDVTLKKLVEESLSPLDSLGDI